MRVFCPAGSVVVEWSRIVGMCRATGHQKLEFAVQ